MTLFHLFFGVFDDSAVVFSLAGALACQSAAAQESRATLIGIQPAANGLFSRQPLPGNIIPASRLDPVAMNFLKYRPEPNQPGTADFRRNCFRTRDIDRRNLTLTSRVDHNFSQRNRLLFAPHRGSEQGECRGRLLRVMQTAQWVAWVAVSGKGAALTAGLTGLTGLTDGGCARCA